MAEYRMMNYTGRQASQKTPVLQIYSAHPIRALMTCGACFDITRTFSGSGVERIDGKLVEMMESRSVLSREERDIATLLLLLRYVAASKLNSEGKAM